MTKANQIKLEKAGRELLELSKSKGDAQTVALAILRANELTTSTLEDLIFRPEANSPEAK